MVLKRRLYQGIKSKQTANRRDIRHENIILVLAFKWIDVDKRGKDCKHD